MIEYHKKVVIITSDNTFGIGSDLHEAVNNARKAGAGLGCETLIYVIADLDESKLDQVAVNGMGDIERSVSSHFIFLGVCKMPKGTKSTSTKGK